ncbi:MAG: hypothetical protein KAT43_03010 [Nanoarchaeota archaeon]|nr:hypothetical protein [Nanoarchaeota archaeon]
MMKKLITFMLMFILCSSLVFAQADAEQRKTDSIMEALSALPIGGGILLGFEAAFAQEYESVIVPGREVIEMRGVIKQVPFVQYEHLGKIFLKVPEKIKKEELPKLEPIPEPPKKEPPKYKKVPDPKTKKYYPVPADDPETPEDESQTPLTDLIDANGDGIIDKEEIAAFNDYVSTTLNIPLDDFDGDGLIDALEIALGTNPLKADSDGDGIPDNTELELGFNPTTYDDITQSFDASEYVEGDDIFVNERGQVSSLGIFVPDSEVIIKVYDPSGTELEAEITTTADSTGRIKVETKAKPSAIITVEGQIKAPE